ncbi:MAG: DUF2065 domain-containing protein [Desulfobulbaceae bacterium]|nr:DUF2065 domain-containing protein [Desulfobulbaceae bacterium]
MKLLIILTGLLLVLEGLPYAAAPEAMQRWLKQILELEPSQLRIMGIVAMAAGFIILLVARQAGLFG